MYNRRTAVPTPRDIAVRHTLSRLRQRYGISATPVDYDVLLGRVESAVEQLSQGRNAQHLKTNIVFDVEFPGPIVRVVYDRVEQQIKTALPMTGDEAFAELTTVGNANFIAQFEADMSAPPPPLPAEGQKSQMSVPLSLMAALMSDISELSIHQIQADITQIRRTLNRLEETWGGFSRTLEEQGVDILYLETQDAGASRIAQRHSCLSLQAGRAGEGRAGLPCPKGGEREVSGAPQSVAEAAVVSGLTAKSPGISFLRMPGDAEFGLYHVASPGMLIGFVQKSEGQWYFLFLPEDGGKPKKLGRCPTRQEAAARLLDIKTKHLEVESR